MYQVPNQPLQLKSYIFIYVYICMYQVSNQPLQSTRAIYDRGCTYHSRGRNIRPVQTPVLTLNLPYIYIQPHAKPDREFHGPCVNEKILCATKKRQGTPYWVVPPCPEGGSFSHQYFCLARPKVLRTPLSLSCRASFAASFVGHACNPGYCGYG